MKKRPADFLIGIVLIYLFIGLCVVSLQGLTGASCAPIRFGGDYVYMVNVNAPRLWLLRALKWLPITWENVVDKHVPIAEFISPQECLWVPNGQTPAEVWERMQPRDGSG